ncbi:Bifunctional cytokinin biosynthesis protein, partial [Lachnellula occidentalis]
MASSGGASPVPPTMNGESSTPVLSNLNPASQPKDTVSSPAVKICVFCGSAPGKSPAHMESARALARVMASKNIQLVYGGGTVGLNPTPSPKNPPLTPPPPTTVGEVARTLVSLSGPNSVHGIIPAPLVKYERGPDSDMENSDLPAYGVYGKTTVVKDMHTRKEMMAKEVINAGPGSGFVAL